MPLWNRFKDRLIAWFNRVFPKRPGRKIHHVVHHKNGVKEDKLKKDAPP